MTAQHLFLKQMYYPTHTRATAYIFGTMVGYYLYQMKTGRMRWKLTPVGIRRPPAERKHPFVHSSGELCRRIQHMIFNGLCFDSARRPR